MCQPLYGWMALALARTWGTRTTALGILGLVATKDEDKRRLATLALGMNVADVALVLRSTGLPARGRLLSALSSGSFAAASGYLLSRYGSAGTGGAAS